MTVEAAAPQKRSPLSVLLDVLIAPSAAFAAIRENPTWFVAYAVTCVLGLIGGYLQVPANEHASIAMISHMPQMQKLTQEQRDMQVTLQTNIQHWVWLAFPIFAIIGMLFSALIYTVANAIGKGSGGFLKFLALAANVAIVNFGISYAIIGVLARFHSPTDFSSPHDVLMLMPSLAWLVPSDAVTLQAFLAPFTPFGLWSLWLTATGIEKVGGVSRVVGWVTASLMILIGACFAAFGAAVSH